MKSLLRIKRVGRVLVILLLLTCFAAGITSCHRVAGNQIEFNYLNNYTRNGDVIYFADGYGRTANLNLSDKTYTLANDGGYGASHSFIVEGGTAPRYLLNIEEGYEGIEDDLLNLELKDNDSSVIYCQAYLIGDAVYGICNVYKDTVGYFSAGGNYGEEEIDNSVYFKYEAVGDNFEVIAKISGAMTVAFSGDTLIYWKNEKFYAYNVASGTETFLIKDYSYDSGFQHQSFGYVTFNDAIAVFILKKASGSSENTRVFAFDFYTQTLTELFERAGQ